MTATRSAPASRASSSAARANRVEPLALTRDDAVVRPQPELAQGARRPPRGRPRPPRRRRHDRDHLAGRRAEGRAAARPRRVPRARRRCRRPRRRAGRRAPSVRRSRRSPRRARRPRRRPRPARWRPPRSGAARARASGAGRGRRSAPRAASVGVCARCGERGADRLPDPRRVGRRERGHVPAGLVAPRPEVVDALLARRRDRGLELGDLLAPSARSSAARAGRRRRAGRRSRAAAGRSGARTGPPRASQCFQYGSVTNVERPGSEATSPSRRCRARPRSPAGGRRRSDPPRAATCATISRRKSTTDASRNACTSGVSSRRHRPAEALGAAVAAARPARRVVDADVRGHHPGRLVPEDGVDAALEHPVGPLAAERAIRGAVQARARDAAPVVEHLAFLRVERDPAALRLAAERAAEPPRARLDGQPLRVRGGDELGHRAAVVREVVLGERVQDARVAARGEVGHVAAHVPGDPHSEVGAACAHADSGRATGPAAGALSAAGPPGWRVRSRVALLAPIQSQRRLIGQYQSLRALHAGSTHVPRPR